MKTDDLERLRAVSPSRYDNPPLFTDTERQLMLSTTLADTAAEPTAAGQRSSSRTWAYRLAPLAAAGTVAAVVVAATGGGSAVQPTRPSHPDAASTVTPAPRIQTAAYVASRARSALLEETTGTLRVDSVDHGSDPVAFIEVDNLASHAQRFTSSVPGGETLIDQSTVGTGDAAITTVVDYRDREWWTLKEGNPGVTQFDSQDVRNQLESGALVLVGDETIDGQAAIHLRYPSDIFTQDGRQYYTNTSDIWVSATTYLPIRERGTDGKWNADLSWSPQPPTDITAVPPAGFAHVDGAPAQTGGG